MRSVLLALTLTFTGCGTIPGPGACSPASCAGCCDNMGRCQLGQTADSCGANGTFCTACTVGTTCLQGICTFFSSTGGGLQGGGSALGGGAGGGTGGGSGGGATGGGSAFTARCAHLERLDNPSAVPFGTNSPNGVCVGIDASLLVDRSALRESYAQCLETTGAQSPGAGNFVVNRYSSGRISSATWSPPSGEGWSQRFNYYSSGLLSSWVLDFSGSSEDVSETFNYYSSGRISSWTRDFSGPSDDVSETFNYYSSGAPSSWSRNRAAGEDVSESYNFYSSGLPSSFSRDFSGPSEDFNESFNYDSSGRISSWSRNYSGASVDFTVSVNYDSSGTVSSISSTGGGVMVTPCP